MHFTQMAIYYIYKSHHIRARPIHGWQGGKMGLATSRGCWLPSVGDIKGCLVGVLKFNKHCSTFVLFDKKISILD
jgi:hypothetical protein